MSLHPTPTGNALRSVSAGNPPDARDPGRSRGNNGFHEPPSAPAELLPRLTGSTVHSWRYSSFIREHDLHNIAIRYDESCKDPYSVNVPRAPGKTNPLVGIFAGIKCPVMHLGYLSGHLQQWTSQGTALGEVVYSLSLAPGESRNIAIIDMRRRQQDRREEQTRADEQLVSNQDHSFALQEVATAVALEHQFGKTTMEASTLVGGGAFVAAGALVGGIGGGIVGTFVEPGAGTAVGAAVGAGAGVVAGGLVFAGAQALGMIESESSGDRDIMASSNQRISQSTSQQSALIRSLWSTVITEDTQEETLQARTSNITNYNHMHALNMEYYEVLHRYEVTTALEGVTPLLYLPFDALPLKEEYLVDEFWDSIRLGLPEELQQKGDAVFVEPPPPEFVAEEVPDAPEPPDDVQLHNLSIDVELQWDLEFGDAVVDERFNDVRIELQLEGTRYLPSLPVTRRENLALGTTVFNALFPGVVPASEITGIRVEVNSPLDIFDKGINLRVRVAGGAAVPQGVIDPIAGTEIAEGDFDYEQGTGRMTRVFSWVPMQEVEAAYQAALAEIEAIETRNARGEAEHRALVEQLDTWKQQVLEAVGREPYRFTRIILSSMESGRLIWILDRLRITGDDLDETGSIPLHQVAHTTPVGISSDSVVLKMKPFDIERARTTGEPVLQLDRESAYDLQRLVTWPTTLTERFGRDNSDLTARETVFLPGAGVFGEAVLGRSNSAEYIDPDRYWNWQDSPIPHQAPSILPVSTSSRATTPLPTGPTVPAAELAQVSAPDFPDPVGLAGVLRAVQNGSLFRDMSKSEQLAGILDNLSGLAAGAVDAASKLTGEAASSTLDAATEIGQQVAAMTRALLEKAPAQAARPPKNPTTATAATTAVDRAEKKSPEVLDATRKAWGIPGSGSPGKGNGSTPPGAPTPDWRPALDQGQAGPGSVPRILPQETAIQKAVTDEVRQILDHAAETTGAMPDTSQLLPPMERWYRDSVIPLLVFARFNDEYLTSAVAQYLDWLSNMQLLGLDQEAQQMESLHGEASPLIRLGLENAIRAAFARMEADNQLDYAADVFDWIALATQLGMDDQSALFNPSEVVSESPLHVVLEGPLEELGTGDQFDLTLSGGLAIGANPPLAGQVVEVEIEVENGSAVPSRGSLHSSLDLVSTIDRDGSDPMTIRATGRIGLFNDVWTIETERSVTLN